MQRAFGATRGCGEKKKQCGLEQKRGENSFSLMLDNARVNVANPERTKRSMKASHTNENPASSLSTRRRVFGNLRGERGYFSMTILRTSLYEPAIMRTK